MSLDGYIAGPGGEYDWIVMDPDFNFSEHLAQVDTFLIGRKTFEAMRQMGSDAQSDAGYSERRLLAQVESGRLPHVVMSDDAVGFVTELRARPARTAGLVDRVQTSLVPVLLGGGIPLLPPPAARTALKFRKQSLYEKTGTIVLEYEIVRA